MLPQTATLSKPQASTTYIIACIYHPPKPHYDTGLLVYELSADLYNLLSTYCDSVFILAGELNTEFLSTDFDCYHLIQLHMVII